MNSVFHGFNRRHVAMMAVVALFCLALSCFIVVYCAHYEPDVAYMFPDGADMVIYFADYESFCRNLQPHFPGISDVSRSLAVMMSSLVFGLDALLHPNTGEALFHTGAGTICLSRIDGNWGICFSPHPRNPSWHQWTKGGCRSQSVDCEPTKEGYYTYEHGGMLYLSRSLEWIHAMREHPAPLPPEHRQLRNTQLLLLGADTSPPFHLILTATLGVPVEGWIGVTEYGANVPLTLSSISSGAAVLALGGSGSLWQPGIDWLRRQASCLLPPTLYQAVREIAKRWFFESSAREGAANGAPFSPREWALSLEGIDKAEHFPVPLFSAAFYHERHVPPLSQYLHGFLRNGAPYSWSNAWSGSISPLLGHSLYLCLAEKEGYALLASREDVMHRLVRDFTVEKPNNALFFARYHWRAAMEAMLFTLNVAADLELLPGYGIKDLQEHLFPVLEGLKREAWAGISGTAGETGIWLRGSLFGGDL